MKNSANCITTCRMSFFILLFCAACTAYAAPADLNMAEQLSKTDPKKAASIYSKFVKDNPLAENAAEAKYKEGLAYEEVGEYYKAYKAYQHIIDNYPLFTNVEELLDRQYRIGNYFLITKSQLPVIPLPSMDREKAVEIFEQVVQNSPFSDIGAKAQYRLGYAYVQMKEYNEAIDELKIVLEKYPNTGYVDDAIYLIAKSYTELSQGPEYDQYALEQSLEFFNRYVNEFGHGKFTGEALTHLPDLNQSLAEKIYLIGQYYEDLERYEAALIYYDDLNKRYPDTFFAEKVRSKRQKLEAVIKMEIPYKTVRKNYQDITKVYRQLKSKDTRQPWEFWMKDTLTESEREKLNWSKELLRIAREHVKEAKDIYKFESKSTLTEIEIRDLEQDTVRLNNQLEAETKVLNQFESINAPQKNLEDNEGTTEEQSDFAMDYIPHFLLYLMRYEPYMKTRQDLKTLTADQRKKVTSIKKKIAHNEKTIAKLKDRLDDEQTELAANKPVLDTRRQNLIAKADELRVEIDTLMRGEDAIVHKDTESISLSEKKDRKWLRGKKSDIETVTEPEPEKPTKEAVILDELSREAAKDKGIMIPYENRLKPNWVEHWVDVLIGPKERVRTPADAKPLLLE
ncbi:MAG: outer membrane protein assembly factor BamD [Candidatus Auribacter fodinae]|uniref:Outer membrane protein assembly factor BamD n=1 Tax=Candidatus Auribacter fodinae TaxID=2093366 RepID=A0A3A4R9D4_9BACT|nr:MAG: outer membrane protein assembly factor BamD [Candidatus Auribacter fodinae]